MSLEDEINDVASKTDVNEVITEILSDATPGAMILVCSTLISALSIAIASGDYDKESSKELAESIEMFSKIIVLNVPPRYTEEALEKVSKIDNILDFVFEERQ